MKYMISWDERPQGSPKEYENAQNRILEVFTQWTAPENFKIEMFVVRVGDWGGHMLAECDDPLTVHEVCGGRLRKVFSPVGIVFKGSGFYRTDSRNGSSSASAPAKDNAKESSAKESRASAHVAPANAARRDRKRPGRG